MWPAETDVPGLAKEELGPNEEWEKGELYMMKVLTPASLHSRLKTWSFLEGWQQGKDILNPFYDRIKSSYDVIENHPCFMQILQMTLAIGNIMNGGTAKGQADGFDLPVLSKITSIKDNTGRTVLQYILVKMYDSDPDLHDKIKEMNKSLQHKDVDVKSMKNKTNDMVTLFNQTKEAFKQVTTSGEPFDKFMQQFEEILKTAQTELDEWQRRYKEIADKHTYMTAFYGIDKNDEMNEKSEDFFKIF